MSEDEREEELKNHFEYFQNQIVEDYQDINCVEMEELYDKFKDCVKNKNVPLQVNGKLHKFIEMVSAYSSNRDEFICKNVEEYLEETETEIEEEEDDEMYFHIFERK